MKILAIDIETRANLVETYPLYGKLYISPDQIIRSTEMVSWAAKYLGEKRTQFMSKYHDGKEDMVQGVWNLLDDCDAVLHFNGQSFDVPHLRREFLQAGMDPPAPFQQIDLLKTFRRQFRFPMNKLAYLTRELGFEGKTEHEGMYKLVRRCEQGEKSALRGLKEYNVRDVTELEKLYWRTLPWIQQHPNRGAVEGAECCPNCGSTHLQRRGVARTQQCTYPRYQCQGCGKWTRGTKRIDHTTMTEVYQP